MPRLTATTLLLVLWVVSASAQTVVGVFEQANQAFRDGKFREAIALYDSIIAGGEESAEIHFNLGNAHYRSGNIGRAILSFERAHRLDPFDDDIEHNLQLARLRTVDRIDPLPELFFITWLRAAHAAVPTPLTRTLFLSAWSMLFVSLIIIFLVRSNPMIRAARVIFLLSTATVVLSGSFLLVQTAAFAEERSAVIQAQTVTAKASPDAQGVDAFVVHAGLKVEVSDEVGEYVRVRLPDGKVGWIPKEDLEEI